MVVLRDYGACCATGTGAGTLARRRPCQKMSTRRRRCLNIRVEKETSQRFSGLVSFTATKKFCRKILKQHDMRGAHQSHLMSHSCESRRGSACVRTVCLLFLSGGEGLRCKECSVFASRVHHICPGVLATSPSRVWARCRGQFKINEF